MTSLERFVELAGDNSPSGRSKLAEAVTDLFFNTEHTPSELQQTLFSDILSRIIDEVAEEVRVFIARRVADKQHVDRKVLLKLAFDEIEVAAPVLEHSPIFLEEDLANIAVSCGDEHRLAITHRTYISEKVSDVLAERGNLDVLRSLAGNRGASYSIAGLRKMLDRGGPDDVVQTRLSERAHEEAEFSAKLQNSLTERLRSRLGEFARYIDEGEFAAYARLASDRYAQAVVEDTQKTADRYSDFKKLVQEELSIDDLVPKYLQDRSRKDRLFDLIWLVARLLKIDENALQQLVLKEDLSTFAVLCRAAGMQHSSFKLFADVLISVLDKDRREAMRLMVDFERISRKSCESIVLLVQRQYKQRKSQIMGSNP